MIMAYNNHAPPKDYMCVQTTCVWSMCMMHVLKRNTFWAHHISKLSAQRIQRYGTDLAHVWIWDDGSQYALFVKCFFWCFGMRTDLAIPCSLQSFFATWYFLSLRCLSVFVSVHDVAILIVHCSWGRQVCPQSCCLSVFHVRLAKTNLRMANTKIAHSWYCTCSGASQSTLVYTI